MESIINAAEKIGHICAKDVLAAIEKPDWASAGRRYDWRNHIPYQLHDSWANLGTEAKLVAYIICEVAARSEDSAVDDVSQS
ncbi:hypothetical protein PLANPX_0445 [Lacipirellula parvula]|uniref:Uncharacterized protein n=1 Tax=Lacipirellula parvula TaxID=2650471 RepID=A0A5K7X8T0_9BACT|nr:hypothetical protein PLANPX_0445 [Lacipirellula parvula]